MTAPLRQRQVQAIADITAQYRSGKVAPLLIMPTGGGKTHTAAEMMRRAVAKGNRVWFLAHLREILGDTARRLREAGMPHGYIMAGQPADRRQQVQVVSVQTAARRLDRLELPNLIIVDEAHLAVAATYQDIFQWAKAGPKFYQAGGAKLLSLTATACRLDGRGLGEIADCIVPTCSSQDLIDEGLLAPIRYYAPAGPDLSSVHTTAGDFNMGELAAIMDKPTITGSAVDHYQRVARHRPAVAFCVSIEHAEHVAAEFRAAGIRAVAVSGETDTVARDAALQDLKTGRVDIVCNCQLFVAGVDVPAVACIIQLAPTQSLTKYLQSIGRGLRMHPGKDDCVVLDHAGNLARHGNPAAAREWTLDGARKRKKKDGEKSEPVKQCPSCFRTVSSLATHCICGAVFPIKARGIEEVEGELSEVDLSAAKVAEAQAAKDARAVQGRAKKLEELEDLARRRGYKRPEIWARAVYQGRAKRDAARGAGV